MARKLKAEADRHVRLNMTIPPRLSAKIDAALEDLRSTSPYRHVSRSDFVAYCLGEWFALIDDINNAPTTKIEVRRHVRKSNLKDSHRGVNGNAVLTPRKVLAIRHDKRRNGLIAKEMGVHDSTIARIKSGSTWRWLSDEPEARA